MSDNIRAARALLEDPWDGYVVILIQELGGQSVSECKKTAGSTAYIAHCLASAAMSLPEGGRETLALE